ncbi:MAG: hypothetical protein ACRDDG_01625 [Cetobacterium sp.]
MAKRNGNKYVNGKDNLYSKEQNIVFDGVCGPFRSFLKRGGVGKVLNINVKY